MADYVLKLYVSGQTPCSQRAIANLRRICEQGLNGRCDLTIIDVLEHPELAEADKILATPTLVREQPGPARRIIGDLSDADKVWFGLDLQSYPKDPTYR
jgi:circadian clock protein KaiB